MQYLLFIPYVNRLDLIEKAIASAVRPFGRERIVLIDNSPAGELAKPPADDDPRIANCPLPLSEHFEILTPPVPLTCPQSFNWMNRIAVERELDVVCWMHNDAEIPDGIGEQFLGVVETALADDPQFGVMFTNYDALCAFNMKAVQATGDWDQHFSQYYCDNDYYRRMAAAGFLERCSNLHVHHAGSATLRSDPARQLANKHFFPAAENYFREKHGL